VVLAIVALALLATVDSNNRPILGILTEPLGNTSSSYIAASYVKFIESAGGRVVPVHHDASVTDLRLLFSQLNGLLFPGGAANIFRGDATPNKFRESAELLYDLAIESNDKGSTFPIHGTCLGFELLSVITAQNDSVICQGCYDTEGTPLPLQLTGAANASKLFGSLPKPLRTALTSENITENSHTSGVQPSVYQSDPLLRDFYRVLSTNRDSSGNAFVSTVEARRYPITATQWHPEKNNFEWGGVGALGQAAIPHSPSAVLLSQYVANDLVARARASPRRFATTQAEKKALIYAQGAGRIETDPNGYFEQIYRWKK